MLRRPLIFLGCLTAIVVAFAVGSVTAIARGWGKPLAFVKVENESGKTISSIEVSFSSCGTHRTLSKKTTDIQTGSNLVAQQSFILPICGEGGHKTRIQFSDGSTVESPGSYIMNGSRIVERVQTDGIRSEISSLSY